MKCIEAMTAACLMLNIAVTGCRSSVSADKSGRELWQSHGIRNYRMTVERGMAWYTSPIHSLTVRDGRVVAVSDSSGADVPSDEWRSRYLDVRTVDEMFHFIDSLGATGKFRLEVTFDEMYGYPDTLRYWWTGRPHVSENNNEYFAWRFEPVK